MIRNTSAGNASNLSWFKSTYSSGSEGDSCVEIANAPGTVHIRDSKHDIEGPRFAVAQAAWAEFVGYASEG